MNSRKKIKELMPVSITDMMIQLIPKIDTASLENVFYVLVTELENRKDNTIIDDED